MDYYIFKWDDDGMPCDQIDFCTTSDKSAIKEAKRLISTGHFTSIIKSEQTTFVEHPDKIIVSDSSYNEITTINVKYEIYVKPVFDKK